MGHWFRREKSERDRKQPMDQFLYRWRATEDGQKETCSLSLKEYGMLTSIGEQRGSQPPFYLVNRSDRTYFVTFVC